MPCQYISRTARCANLSKAGLCRFSCATSGSNGGGAGTSGAVSVDVGRVRRGGDQSQNRDYTDGRESEFALLEMVAEYRGALVDAIWAIYCWHYGGVPQMVELFGSRKWIFVEKDKDDAILARSDLKLREGAKAILTHSEPERKFWSQRGFF